MGRGVPIDEECYRESPGLYGGLPSNRCLALATSTNAGAVNVGVKGTRSEGQCYFFFHNVTDCNATAKSFGGWSDGCYDHIRNVTTGDVKSWYASSDNERDCYLVLDGSDKHVIV